MTMKKGLSALLCLLMLTGCTHINANVSAKVRESRSDEASYSAQSEPEASSAPEELEGEESAELSAAATLPVEPYHTATAAEAFEGPVEFVTEEAGSYRFVAAQSDENLSWEIYTLDEEFEESPRYLSQAFEPAATLEGDGEAELMLQADQFVYCICSENAFTADAPGANGELSVYFVPTSEEEQLRAVDAGSAALDVDAADVWEDGGYSFQAEQDAVYTLTREGDADWEIYVLDEEFEDSFRYLPQAFDSAAVNEGTVSVQQGQMVYCLCSENPFTSDEAPERGVDVLHLTAE